tara:strand:+ start:41 stop:790 length:750 start_codon:yes stop_codon:yes gene_type:complete
MEKAICLYDGSYITNGSNDLLFTNCIKSLRQHSSCEIIIYKTSNVNIDGIKNLNNITFIEFKKNDWENKKMCFRIQTVYNHHWNLNDKVIVFDVDMFFLDNPFKIFKNKFDYFYTTRSDIKTSSAAINEGLTGFIYSEKVKNFYNFWINQIHNTTWNAFKKNNLNKNKWLCGQHFLCCLYENKNNLPNTISNVNFFDATCHWNYTTVKNNFNDIYNKIKNKSVGVVHLKGGILKQTKYVSEFLKILDID